MNQLKDEQTPAFILHPSSLIPRLGFLGVGWIGRNRLEAIATSGVAEVVAIADPARESAAQAAAIAPGAVVAGSLGSLLEAGVDGIVIATPSALHAEQALAALESGMAVFCQKPLGRNAPETCRVVDAARAANRLLGVDLSYRFTTGMQRIRDLIRQDALGRIYAADLVFHNAYGPDKPWFYDRALSGGGCVIDLGIHLVDLALWALDNPLVVDVSGRLFGQGELLHGSSARVEDYAVARLDLADGAVAQIACSWKLPVGGDAVISASFYGTRGGATLRNVNGSFYDFIAERFTGAARETLCAPPDAWSGRAVVDWATRLAAGAGFHPEIERVCEVATILDAIYST
ncbi:MAG: Gfo/Idh/MocA family oxidoreductase [Chloroflexi bacterium]|nr:Gfo/Idh/MocA family oxidoreductase [Chloroflexota bacterium]